MARHILSTNDASVNKMAYDDLSSPHPTTKILFVTPGEMGGVSRVVGGWYCFPDTLILGGGVRL